MVHFQLSNDKQWLQLTDFDDLLDQRQVEITFLKKVKNHWLYEKKGWNGEINFFYKGKWLPVGLWGELVKMGADHKIEVKIDGLDGIFYDLTLEEFRAWVDDFFKGSKRQPRDYQIDAAYKMIKYRYSVQELATNAGKTLMTFMVVAYMLQHKLVNKIMVIVPNTNLANQMQEDFADYEEHRDEKVGIKMHLVYSGQEEMRPSANLCVGTFQSLVKKDPEFHAQFDAVCVDEAHHSSSVSIKSIISKCVNAKWRFGMSGTLGDPKFADYYTIQQFLGPMVGKISPDFLFQNEYATPVDVRIIKMNYLDMDIREKLFKNKALLKDTDPAKVYNMEKQIVIHSHKRLAFICDMIAKSSKNTLVLYNSVEEGYGKKIYERLKDITSEKEIYYVDGGTKADLREEYKLRMKSGENRILIASFGTFSTGISIDNLHNIFLVESYKSERIVKQSIGRMMRKHEDKDVAIVVDFVDDFSYKGKPNHLMKHSLERIEIYKREKFPYNIFEVDLNKIYD